MPRNWIAACYLFLRAAEAAACGLLTFRETRQFVTAAVVAFLLFVPSVLLITKPRQASLRRKHACHMLQEYLLVPFNAYNAYAASFISDGPIHGLATLPQGWRLAVLLAIFGLSQYGLYLLGKELITRARAKRPPTKRSAKAERFGARRLRSVGSDAKNPEVEPRRQPAE